MDWSVVFTFLLTKPSVLYAVVMLYLYEYSRRDPCLDGHLDILHYWLLRLHIPPHGPNRYVFTTMEAGGEGWDPVKLV